MVHSIDCSWNWLLEACPRIIRWIFSHLPYPATSCVAIRATIYRSLRALRGQNRKKVSKIWGSARKSPKMSKKLHKIGHLGVFFDFFGYFRGLFCRPPKRLFLRLFCDFGPGGPGDSCKWSLARIATLVLLHSLSPLSLCHPVLPVTPRQT